MYTVQYVFFITMFSASLSQRSPYAGLRPIGFPEIETPVADNSQSLGNRFGNGTTSNVTTTTQRLPVEALGDRQLFNRLGQLPQDKQPFWYINWKALEENRNRPQTYEQKPNIFNVAHERFPDLPQQSQVNRVNNVPIPAPVPVPFNAPIEMSGNRANAQINPNPIPNQMNTGNFENINLNSPPSSFQQGNNVQRPNPNLPIQNLMSDTNIQRPNPNAQNQVNINNNNREQAFDASPFDYDDSSEIDFRNPSNPNEGFIRGLPSSPSARGFRF